MLCEPELILDGCEKHEKKKKDREETARRRGGIGRRVGELERVRHNRAEAGSEGIF